jgi:hypothetical protein
MNSPFFNLHLTSKSAEMKIKKPKIRQKSVLLVRLVCVVVVGGARRKESA